ncbi:unnamed protein product [Caenorhabditis auriculariae]|uniref:Uncharacterized protein n=1 Tax=Caenorhabditis auriculariae TaxID=2777116 RepID=A0A8S1GSZ3_9PELO|nr:unnamed protein product [Caenorhabditis auriculariae]
MGVWPVNRDVTTSVGVGGRRGHLHPRVVCNYAPRRNEENRRTDGRTGLWAPDAPLRGPHTVCPAYRNPPPLNTKTGTPNTHTHTHTHTHRLRD